MSATYQQAIDEIFQVFNDAWNLGSAAIVGYIPETRWQGVEIPSKANYSKYWVRVSQQTIGEPQTTLRNADDGQRYTPYGLCMIQLYCPRSDSENMQKGRSLAALARNAYRGQSTPSQVWFRNARIVEVEPDEKWTKFNILVEYEYDEII